MDFLQDEYLQAAGTSIDLGLFDLIERCEEEALNEQRSTSALCKIVGLQCQTLQSDAKVQVLKEVKGRLSKMDQLGRLRLLKQMVEVFGVR
jgi:hypothetical protein